MRVAVLTIALVAAVCLLAAPVAAHVRLLQTGYPIRNAASPKLDGAYSVSGPCGGVRSYGAQGITTIASGSVLSLTIAYNGGHQDANNAFHAAYYCGTIAKGSDFDDAKLRLASQPATLNSPGLLPLTDGTALVPAADSSTAGYQLTFKAPVLPAGATQQDCVIALLDQRQWGGCIDVSLVRAGEGEKSGESTTLGNMKSPCSRYCDMMGANCVGQYAQFPDRTACMSACGNYTQVDEPPGQGVYSGENLQCRQHHVEYVAMYPQFNYTHCPHAAAVPARDGGCYQSIADGPRAVAPCWTYCNAVEANCASSKFYADRSACLAACAGFLSVGLGSDVGKGNNTQCRTASAIAGGASCADANPTATGECAVANPLKINDDIISAVYHTQPGQCDTPEAAAANTISGCCCVSGSITVIHVKGSVLATVSSNLTISGGQMCNAGFQSIPNAADHTKPNANYTFDSAVTIAPLDFLLRQTTPGESDLKGTFSIGPDPFTFELVHGATTLDNLLVITNNAPSDRAPRVCSIQAKAVSKIDSTGLQPPADPACVANPQDPSCVDVGSSAASTQVALVTILGMVFATMVNMRA